MTKASEMVALAERVEAAKADQQFVIITEAALRLWDWQDDRYRRVLRLCEAGGFLDAAMTLAEPGWWFDASAPLSPAAYGYSREDQRMPRAGFQMMGPPYSVGARAATPALALTAACLRARAALAQASSDGEEGLPDGLRRHEGELQFQCRVCEHWTEWPDDVADFDPDAHENVCGGSPRCCP